MQKFALILLLMLSGACSHQIVQVTEETKDMDGVRFYLPEPYLMVAEKAVIVDGLEETVQTESGPKTIVEKMQLEDKQLIASIVYLPNSQKEYLIKNADPKEVVLKDGWRFEGFASYEQDNDQKQIRSLLEVLTGTKGLEPGLYRFVRDEVGNIGAIQKILITQ